MYFAVNVIFVMLFLFIICSYFFPLSCINNTSVCSFLMLLGKSVFTFHDDLQLSTRQEHLDVTYCNIFTSTSG